MKFSLYFMGYEVKHLLPFVQESFVVINSLIVVHVDLFNFLYVAIIYLFIISAFLDVFSH